MQRRLIFQDLYSWILGFLSQKEVVWETLANIEGDCSFVNSTFKDSGLHCIQKSIIKGTVSVILSATTMQRRKCTIHNVTLYLSDP